MFALLVSPIEGYNHDSRNTWTTAWHLEYTLRSELLNRKAGVMIATLNIHLNLYLHNFDFRMSNSNSLWKLDIYQPRQL